MFSPDAWLTFAGTIIGAGLGTYLAGRFTLKSVKKQLSYEKLSREKEEIELYLKESYKFVDEIRYSTEVYSRLFKAVEGESLSRRNEIFTPEGDELTSTAIQVIEDTAEKVKEINLNSLPYEVFEDYLLIKREIDVLDKLSLRVLEYYQHNTDGDYSYVELHKESLSNIKDHLQKIDEYDKIKRDELELINQKISHIKE